MAREILLFLGWLLAALALWAALVALEVYWNLYDWQPKLDSRAFGLGFGLCSAVAATYLLTRAGRQHAARCVSLVICLALLGLAVYVFPAEPLTTGLFARERPSPLWYRGGRFAVLALPTLFWMVAWFRRNSTRRQSSFCAALRTKTIRAASSRTPGPKQSSDNARSPQPGYDP